MVAMAGLVGLSIDPLIYGTLKSAFPFEEVLFWETFYHQHLGEQFGGFAVFKDGRIKNQSLPGHIRPNFGLRMREFQGTEGIGYCGVSPEPLDMFSKFGEVAVCFSGNIINKKKLLNWFVKSGHVFMRGKTDAELFFNLMARGENIFDGFRIANRDVNGAIAFLILSSDGIYAAVSPDSHWPMIIGKRDGGAIIASESGGFSNLGFSIDRVLKPGEVIRMKNGKILSLGQLNSGRVQICKFLWVYTAHPTAVIYGVPADLVRERLGACLAKSDIKNGFIPDIVSYVPDSGRCHGDGYHNEFCRARDAGEINRVPLKKQVLYKYPYAGRSYMPPDEESRKREAYFKILVTSQDYSGKVLVLCDDSVVRGIQIGENLAPKLKSAGFKEIHVRASNPPLLGHCPYGKTTQPGETLADKYPEVEKRAAFLGVTSLKYNSLEDLYTAIGLDPKTLCVDCAVKK